LLPLMRRDLKLYPGPPGDDGSPSWTLHDPLRQRFFRLGWLESTILSQWGAGSWERILKAAQRLAGPMVTVARVEEVARFLIVNELSQPTNPGGVKQLIMRHHLRQQAVLTWLFHNYLFIKIPLFHPDRFLQAGLPFVRLLVSRSFLTLLILLGVLGIYLTLRQWDGFMHALPDAPSPMEAAVLVIALMITKAVHELGHAFAACHYGCRVPSLGVAFIVLWPVLYADTSDIWKLVSRRARLVVGAAGVGAELGLALLATFAWHFLGSGPFRDAIAWLATVTWISTLVINLNPLMRFDGYYLLSDITGIPNLGPRAFALAQWHLREIVFDFGIAPPERWPTRKYYFLLGYAYATWCYRALVFIGIALLVYHKFFKLAGIILMCAELGWFVAWPVARFFYQTPCSRIRGGRLIFLFVVLSGLIALTVIPWRQSVEVPALLAAEEHVRLFAPVPARVTEVLAHVGDVVTEGTHLLTLEAPDLERSIVGANARMRVLELEANQMASRPLVLAMRLTLERRLAEVRGEKQGYETQKAMLTVTAPFSGKVSAVQEGLAPGRWVSRTTVLMELIKPEQAIVEAWVPEMDIDRLIPGVEALFLPNRGMGEPVPVVLTRMDRAAVDRLSRFHLTSTHGGPIVVRQDGHGGVVPTDALYRTLLTPVSPVAIVSTLPGTVRIPARQQNIWDQVWSAVASVWIRESGF
ncbi:MAG: HlyD family efflux transporter periplasmic adaptor subunit, partial [Magnetococcus sp. YQC-5]